MIAKWPVIIGNVPEIVKIRKIVDGLGCMDETVLIRGEPGTGKDLVANSIHCRSHRAKSPCIKLDASRLGGDFFGDGLSESDTTAPVHRIGGRRKNKRITGRRTFLVDRIEDMQADVQARLLRVLDGKEDSGFEPGAPKLSGVRIIAMTNCDLESSAGFRKDLYHRLNVIPVEVPPLRRRPEDIPLLADFFAKIFCREFRRPRLELPRETQDLFRCYDWPGNVKELKNVVKQAVESGRRDDIHGRFVQYCDIASKPLELFYAC